MLFPPISSLTDDAVHTLAHLVSIPALSRDETAAADYLESLLRERGAEPKRLHNNIWCTTPHADASRPTLLLNAHVDTVRPTDGWQHNPFCLTADGDKLYGLGSNDCGGGLVSLMEVFLTLRERTDLPWNLIYLASAEEEVSGRNGIESVLPVLPHIDCALVGEPTGMQPAVAEKGLMVLDCTAHGRSGHAARREGVNALYEALADVEWFRTHRFPKVSPLLGEVRMTVTMIAAGTQHNVVPDKCTFVVDVRPNECYANAQLLAEIRSHVGCDVKERSTRLNSSSISTNHPLVRAAVALGRTPYGSPTLSDQALMPFPSLKMGPGRSERSHTADEFILRSEIEHGIADYLTMLSQTF